MNRRDTIIIAVLLNAGVLAILFMLAVNDREVDETFSSQLPPIVRQEYPAGEVKAIALAEAVHDDFLEFNMDDSFQAIEEAAPAVEEYTLVAEAVIPETPKPPKPFQPPKPKTPPIPAEPYVAVTVKRGDSLDRLARHNGTTIEAIKKANHLKSDMLTVGQVLNIPATPKPIAQKEVKKTPALPEGSYYVMKTGDSPWKIAKNHHMNLDELLRLNNLDEEKARNLKVGDKLRIK